MNDFKTKCMDGFDERIDDLTHSFQMENKGNLSSDACRDLAAKQILSTCLDNLLVEVEKVIEEMPAFHPVDRGYASQVADDAKNPSLGTNYLKQKDVLQALASFKGETK